ncbi:MAG: CHAP domain-containing protein [Planctomycetota bacterium]|jgi:hypothetical protein
MDPRTALASILVTFCAVAVGCAGESATEPEAFSPGGGLTGVTSTAGGADVSGDASEGGVGEVAEFLPSTAVPPRDEQEGIDFKSRAGEAPPACGQPIVDPRTRRTLSFNGHVAYSNGYCQGLGTSCGRSYSDAQRQQRKAADPGNARCYETAGRTGEQPRAVDYFDPTRSSFPNKWQCVELVNRVFAAEWQVYGWGGNGGQKLETAPSGVTVYYNGRAGNRAPVAGDAIVYGGGQYGHVALVSRVEGSNVYVIGQNEALFERRHVYDARSGTLQVDRALPMEVRGWAHADRNGAAPDRGEPAGGLPSDDWGSCAVDGVRGRCIESSSCGGVSEAGHCPGPAGIQCCIEVRAAAPADGSSAGGEPACRDHGWRCSDARDYRYRCENGVTETERCAHGCQRRTFSQDYCNAPPADAGSDGGASGAGNGGDAGQCDSRRYRNWACDDQGRRFRCVDGAWDIEDCPHGCKRRLFGEDRCEEGPSERGAEPAPAPAAGGICGNTCDWADDGECDDGGAGSHTSACAYGTDCGDCGARAEAAPPRAQPVNACENTCAWANDGECDDGGAGSQTSACEYGTDCDDCGAR